MAKTDWDLLDRQALGVICLTLTQNVAFNIINDKTTAGLMKALSNMYEKPSASNKVYLMRRLLNLKMTEGGSVTEYINEFNIILTQLSSVNRTIDDKIRALILLSSLPESWSAIVTAVSSSSGSTKLKLNDIRDLVLSEDIHRRESSDSPVSSFNTESRGKSNQRGQSYGRGGSKSKRRGQSKNRKDITCWNCDKKGHYSSQYSPVESWILDSGSSFHSTSFKELLHNYIAGKIRKFYLADGEPLDIAGKVEVHINTSQEIKDEEPEAKSEEELKAKFVLEPESELEIESNAEPNLESGHESNSVSVTHEPILRRYNRVTNAPDRLTLFLHYLPLTDAGELEHFFEAMQVIDSDK
uniref:Retrovirus-related Pol polyprotein from transposon TNT 1-94-like beta-barrel domain-containing protein n=1 Tax=Nicotiana tabacum TaxID=4097 RepID=A0A1S4AT95_TOBAC|nr:PREDICTED: uncharacterized protein LOC107800975 [Nicotiana tabacum]